MYSAIARKPISYNTHKTKHDVVHADFRSSSAALSHPQIPIIQRKSTCPCDGGCPRCSGVIQPKLTIGQPNDVYEQEADRVAELVMRMPENESDSDSNSEIYNPHSAIQMKPG
jgi:hypothetical protein